MKSTFPGEVVKDVAFYDYDAKYIDNKITMAIPAQLDPEVVKIMQTNAEKAFRAIGGLGLARCDFFYTDKGEIFLNELNTMPGFTQWTMYPLSLIHIYPDEKQNNIKLCNASICIYTSSMRK